jgi:hypothetical protein
MNSSRFCQASSRFTKWDQFLRYRLVAGWKRLAAKPSISSNRRLAKSRLSVTSGGFAGSATASYRGFLANCATEIGEFNLPRDEPPAAISHMHRPIFGTQVPDSGPNLPECQVSVHLRRSVRILPLPEPRKWSRRLFLSFDQVKQSAR